MLTDISALEHWLSFASPDSEIVYFENAVCREHDLEKAAQTSSAFAHCYERLKRAADAKAIYLSVDSHFRCIATMLPKAEQPAGKSPEKPADAIS
jgi:hypothetical protein